MSTGSSIMECSLAILYSEMYSDSSTHQKGKKTNWKRKWGWIKGKRRERTVSQEDEVGVQGREEVRVFKFTNCMVPCLLG